MTTSASLATQSPENIIPLTVEKPSKVSPPKIPQRFKIQEFINRGGSTSWRVTGIKRDGSRIRENCIELEKAQCRQIELETEYLRSHAETTIRATKLTSEQIQLAEVAVIKLGDDWIRLLDCVDHWHRTGAKNIRNDAPRIDEAVEQYLAWLKDSPLRDATKRSWKIRMNVFRNSVQNIRVSEATPDFIHNFLTARNVADKDTDRRAVSRFFSWCLQHPRRWVNSNPCREVKLEKREKGAPAILTVEQCKLILKTASSYKNGRLAPYVAVCLFAGLRPTEAARLQWTAVNLKDGVIRLEANQTKTGRKTGRGRVLEICDTLKSWLKEFQGKSFFPSNWRKDFDVVKKIAGFGNPKTRAPKKETAKEKKRREALKPWPDDVLRHTAISHYFRLHNSYGKAAEQFGTSEAIIKKHYQARVSTEETRKFYELKPDLNPRKRAATAGNPNASVPRS